jgi:plasmid stabilization system protein ParE
MATYRYLVTVEDAVQSLSDMPEIRDVIRNEITSNLESVYPYANVAVVKIAAGFTMQPLPTRIDDYDY